VFFRREAEPVGCGNGNGDTSQRDELLARIRKNG